MSFRVLPHAKTFVFIGRPILSWVRAFQPFTKNTFRNHPNNHSKIIKKSTQSQLKINSQIISSFSSIFCMKNVSLGSHFENKMASKTHPKTYSKFHRFLDRVWKAFWLPFSSIWHAKFFPKRIQAAPGAHAGSKRLPRSLRTPKMLQK